MEHSRVRAYFTIARCMEYLAFGFPANEIGARTKTGPYRIQYLTPALVREIEEDIAAENNVKTAVDTRRWTR